MLVQSLSSITFKKPFTNLGQEIAIANFPFNI